VEGSDNMIWTFDHIAGTAKTSMGIYPGGTFPGGFVNRNNAWDDGYGWAWNGISMIAKRKSTSDLASFVPSGDVRLRITLGDTDGALWEYDELEGAGWVELADARDTAHADNPVNTGETWQSFMMAGNTGGQGEFDNVVFSYGADIGDVPFVDAGDNQLLVLPDNIAKMAATASDDGLPSSPGVLTYAWSQVSGPTTVSFDNAAVEDPNVTFPSPPAGSLYVLELEVDDGLFTNSDTVTITFSGLGRIEFIDYFDGTTIDPAKWVVTEGTGTIIQNEVLTIDNDEGYWNNTYVTSIPAASSSDSGDPLTFTVDFAGGGVQAAVGLYHDGTLSDWKEDMIYGWIHNGTLYAGQDREAAGSWLASVSTPGIAMKLRITLGSVDGALWEHNQGAGWQTLVDTRNLGTGPVNTGKTWQLYLMAGDQAGMSGSSHKRFDNVLLSYGYTGDMPSVEAGTVSRAHLPDQHYLDATASDDGVPAPPSLTLTWSQVGSPLDGGTATFSSISVEDPNVTCDADGVYALKLEADDGFFAPSDIINIVARDEDLITNVEIHDVSYDANDPNADNAARLVSWGGTHINYIEDTQDLSLVWRIPTTNPGAEWVIFDLGGEFDLYRVEIWNHASANEDFNDVGVKSMDILASNDPDFGGTPESLVGGGITVLPKGPYDADAGSTAYGEKYSASPTGGPYRYVKLDINSNHGDLDYVGLATIEFYGTTTDDCADIQAHFGYQTMEGDIDDNCVINLVEFADFATTWLNEHSWIGLY
ncbi:MAG: hypothetical protein DRP56_05455, partial [Planctomycetota bacterium]